MIKITITRTFVEKFSVRENVIATSKPTAIRGKAERYDDDNMVQYEKTYQVMEVEKTRETVQTLLTQEVDNEKNFDLQSVIMAINNISNMASEVLR